MSDRWRGVVAALLNPDLRAVLAEVIAADELSDARRARALARLVESGLVREGEDGPEFDEASVRGILAADPPAKKSGPARFLDGSGRIDRYPVQDADRLELLRWVAARAFEPGEVLSERATNERLGRFADDVAGLRRALVDAELLERTRSGSAYALVESAD
ncbi:DUF2087 domain-containing protein [Microbacterium sulfonylureivorans]|uniref:DUF2087 domain-containing protein n=1 Tax=Microbacterium sulfonylureivorans TaxID=2486854 RepID=UPI000FD71542|nr:DUF2087 domain-containing protein [Microbacterium sulfonylureivorans]